MSDTSQFAYANLDKSTVAVDSLPSGTLPTRVDVRSSVSDEYSELYGGQILMTYDDAIACRTDSQLTVRSVLLEAIAGFKRYMGYVSAHTAHIMGFTNDEEFQRASALYAIEPGMNAAYLPDKIQVLAHETGIAFEPEELSELFSATLAEVDAALAELSSRDNGA